VKSGLSIIILNLDRPDLIVPQLELLVREKARFAERGLTLEILVGDTGSKDRKVLAAYDRLANDVVVMRNLR
jgi:hypothetical protein